MLSATILVGAGVGAVVGGLGGRLAMRILFLTTGDSVKGVTSDDGFFIGRFTLADTASLVAVTTLLGIVAALLYLGARPFVLHFGRLTVPLTALFYGVVGGALLVKPEGVDFRVLEPAALAIAMFVAIFAVFGGVVSWAVNAAARENSWAQRWSWWVLGPPLVVLAFPAFLIVAIMVAVLQQGSAASRPWRVVRGGALLAMGSGFSLAAINLASDTLTLT